MKPNFKHNKRKQPRELSFDQMFRQWKKSCEKAGTVEEVRERRYYEKPASKKNAKNQRIKRRKYLDKVKLENRGYRRK